MPLGGVARLFRARGAQDVLEAAVALVAGILDQRVDCSCARAPLRIARSP